MTTQELVIQEITKVARAVTKDKGWDWRMVDDRRYSNTGTLRWYDSFNYLQAEIGYDFQTADGRFTLVFAGTDQKVYVDGERFNASHIPMALDRVREFLGAEQ